MSGSHGAEVHLDSGAKRGGHATAMRNNVLTPSRRGYATHRPPERVDARVSPIENMPAPHRPSPPPIDEKYHHHRGLRADYFLGEAIRSRSDMISMPTHELATCAAASLKVHDFAFVGRSDGSFTYAVLAYRRRLPRLGAGGDATTGSPEDCLTFVVCERGYTKTIPRRFWHDAVRLARVPPTRPEPCREIDIAPPSVIAFAPHEPGEECSVISNVSDRARARV